jgi:calcineurin-like phosphoesterase family protein
LWEPRGFNAAYEHDAWLEKQCDTLTEDDLLIFLGDFALNTTKESTMALLNRIKAQIFFIFGNHNSVVKELYKNALEGYLKVIDSQMGGDVLFTNYQSHRFDMFPFTVNKYNKQGEPGMWLPARNSSGRSIVFFGEEETFKIDHNYFYCRHMAPYIWDDMKHHNVFALCGHSHGNAENLNINANKMGKILDVGVDNAMIHNKSAFFDIEEIVEIMKKKDIKIYDHHGDDNV